MTPGELHRAAGVLAEQGREQLAGGQLEPAHEASLRRSLATHLARGRDARSAAEDVRVRWDAACRRSAAQIRTEAEVLRQCATRSHDPEPIDVQGLVVGVVRRMMARLSSVFGGSSGSPAGPIARRLEDLPDRPLTASEYQDLAREHVRSLLPDGLENDRFAQNQAITTAYAQRYRLDPDTFKWAGMAAFASELVGSGMRQAELRDDLEELSR